MLNSAMLDARFALTAVLLAGCAAAPPPSSAPAVAPVATSVVPATPVAAADPPPAAVTPRGAAARVRKAKVLLSDDALGASLPLVDVTVGGLPAQLILDTGASHHVIAGWLAREIGVAPSGSAGSATAHGGDKLGVGRLEGVTLAISGYGSVDASALLVTEMPEDMRRRGIGGVISPQALVAPGRAVLLDLAAGELTEVSESAGATWLEGKGQPFDGIHACARVGAGALVAQATIDGEEAGLQLDTGSTTTSLAVQSPLGKRFDKRSKGTSTQITASGLHTVPTVLGAVVKLGPFASELNLDLIPRAPTRGCGDGYAGMDVLRSCALLIGGGGARLWCGARR